MRSSLTAMSSPQPFEQRRHAECTQRSGSPSHSTRPSCRGCIGGSLALCRWTGKGCADRVSGCIAWPLARFRACRYCPTAATHPGVVVAESSGDVGGLSRSGAPSTRGRRDFVSGRSSSSSFGVGRAPLPAPGTSAASGRDTSPVAAGVEARSFGRQSASTAFATVPAGVSVAGYIPCLVPGRTSARQFAVTFSGDHHGRQPRQKRAGRLGRDARFAIERRPAEGRFGRNSRSAVAIGNSWTAEPAIRQQRPTAVARRRHRAAAKPGQRQPRSTDAAVRSHGSTGSGWRLQQCHQCWLERQLWQRRAAGPTRCRWPRPGGADRTRRSARPRLRPGRNGGSRSFLWTVIG